VKASKPRSPARFDSDRLADALVQIDRARQIPRANPGRLRALLAGLQALLDVEQERRSRRDLDGVGALTEIESLLLGAGAEAGLQELQRLLEPVIERLVEGLSTPTGSVEAMGSGAAVGTGTVGPEHKSTLRS